MALFLWVLLPVGLAGFAGHLISNLEGEAIADESTARLGRLGASLLRGEMGYRSASLSREAGAVTDPDLRSPLIRAALDGDTVAALGTSSGELTLSLALTRSAGDSLELRAITAPFAAETLDLLRARAGLRTALYLRERKARGSPEDFGPARLPEDAQGSALQGSILLPLTGSGSGPSPARILVAPIAPRSSSFTLRRSLFLILLAWSAAGLLWLIPVRQRGSTRHRARRLTLIGVPLLLLWILLANQERTVAIDAGTLLRQDLVRVLAAIQDAGEFLSAEEIPAATGFLLVERSGGRVLNPDLPPGLDAGMLLAIPVLESRTPTLGKIEDHGRQIVYAGLAGSTESELLLIAPEAGEGLESFRLLLAGLGGMASFLALGFLARYRKDPAVGPPG